MRLRLSVFLSGLWMIVNAWADPPLYVVDTQLETQSQNIYQVLNGAILNSINKGTMANQYTNINIQKGLIGNSNIGLVNNLEPEQTFRNWTPTSADLASMVQQGLQTGSLSDQIKYYNQKFNIPQGNAKSPAADYGVFSAVATNAALGIADKGFDNAIYIQQQINFLYQQLDRQQTLKQAQDFNSVILLKIAAFQADLIRLQSQQLKITAVSQQENNVRRTTMNQFVEDIK